MELNKTICLNMIVKDESHVIEKTLENLLKYIRFDYWVICDTGSTDNTIEIIENFFNKQSIRGSIYKTAWVDFGYNRTDALKKAYNLTDYVLMWDADDSIHGNFILPTNLSADWYRFTFGTESFKYSRCVLFNNRKHWKYVGVLHEYPACDDSIKLPFDIMGDYYFISGRSGNRNKDPMKYLRDAEILEKAFKEEYEKKNHIYMRYAYYCADSYKSFGNSKKAIEWYKKVLTLENWLQEKYVSCLYIYRLYEKLNKSIKGIVYLVESYKYDKERVECFYELIKYYCINGMNEIALMYYLKIQSFYENKYHPNNQSDKLFVDKNIHVFHLPYYVIIVTERCNHKNITSKMYDLIFTYQYTDISEWWIDNLFNNIQFCIDELPFNKQFIDNMFSYINKLRLKNIFLNDKNNEIIDKIIQKYKPLFCKNIIDIPKKWIDGMEPINILFSVTTCKRLDLFKQTIQSMFSNWTDIFKINYYYCVDDNSSEEDRKEMVDLYPFFNFYMKTPLEKGHRESMNIIWNKLNELKPTYWVHMEDDWLFFQKKNYITRGIELLEKYKNLKINQIVFNKNYGLKYSDHSIMGGITLEHDFILHEKKDNVTTRNCAYWPHYSLQPSIIRTSAILELGNYDSKNEFFERDYADKYFANDNKTGFYSSIYSLHIGKNKWETDKKNAYELNNISQFNTSLKNINLFAGYNNVFNDSNDNYKKHDDKLKLFNSFRFHNNIFEFIHNEDTPPDEEAINIAQSINKTMYDDYVNLLIDRKKLGYDKSSQIYADYNNLDSRHIMMSVLCFTNIKEKIENIVEIGGGFGNWFYLNRNKNFKNWFIIDLPFICELQKWYLTETNIDTSKLNILFNNNYLDTTNNLSIDLVIGAHSLSEFSLDIFNEYYKNIILKTKYFLYCCHNTLPTIQLITVKNYMINKDFDIVNSFMSENNEVTNVLYINKKYIYQSDNILQITNSNVPLVGTMMDHLLQIIAKIKSKTPFGLIRPSDGEHKILLDETLTNVDNWTFTKGGILKKQLLESVGVINPNLYIGIPCNTCNLQWNCTDKIYNDFIYKFKVPIDQRTYANIFGNSNWHTFIEFIKSYEDKIYLITSGTMKYFKNEERFVIDKYLVNNWDNLWESETNKLLDFINEKTNQLFLFSAGPISKIWIPICMKKYPNNMYVDVGGSVDILTKGVSNRFYTDKNHSFAKQSCIFKN